MGSERAARSQEAKEVLDKFDADELDDFLYGYLGEKIVKQIEKNVADAGNELSDQVANILNSY